MTDPRVTEWARLDGIRHGIPGEYLDAYVAATERSVAGQSMALHLAVRDLWGALKEPLVKVVDFVAGPLSRTDEWLRTRRWYQAINRWANRR